MALEVFSVVICAAVLFIALRWGVMATGGLSVSRAKEPVIFWLTVGLTVAILIVMLLLIATGN